MKQLMMFYSFGSIEQVFYACLFDLRSICQSVSVVLGPPIAIPPSVLETLSLVTVRERGTPNTQ
jgi:hypothetical protein